MGNRKITPTEINNFAIRNPHLDKRVKLLPKDKEDIINLSNKGVKTLQIARYYNVSWHTINYIINPDKLSEMREKQKGKIKVPAEVSRERNKRHINYKREILLKKRKP